MDSLLAGRGYAMILAKTRSRDPNGLQTKGRTSMATDVTGRLIKVGDVCGFASRRRSQIFLDLIVIRQVNPELRGDKITRVYSFDNKSHITKLVPTKPIQVSSHLIITGLTEKEAVSLIDTRKE